MDLILIIHNVHVEAFLLELVDGAASDLGVIHFELLQRGDVLDGRQALDVGVVDEQVLQFCQS